MIIFVHYISRSLGYNSNLFRPIASSHPGRLCGVWLAGMVAGIVSDYPKVKHRFTRELVLYLQSGAWALMDSSLYGSGYSFETFLHWRKISGAADGSIELLMLLENGNPPSNIVDHLMVKVRLGTLLNICQTL